MRPSSIPAAPPGATAVPSAATVASAAGRAANAATRALDRLAVAREDRDWHAFRAACAPEARFESRRRMALVAGDLDRWIADQRTMTEQMAGMRLEMTLLGTAGERVAVVRQLFRGGPVDHSVESACLLLGEVDAAGRVVAAVVFDDGDRSAAQHEAWTRWGTIEPAVAPHLDVLGRMLAAFNAHDVAAYSATVADDVVVVDHRRTGMGRIEGVAAYAANTGALWKLAPGSQAELGWQWPAYGLHGVVTVVRRHGESADGSEYLGLFVQAEGRFTNIEVFERDALDAALARFAELGAAPTAAASSGRMP